MTWTPGHLLGHYQILSPIGAGGMGEVWKALDTRLDRTVAIKRLKAEHAERFKRESRAIAALNHPHICQLYDVGPDYMVMEYVEGAPLQGPLPVAEAVRLAIQIADALAAAHRKGIIHRDLKPANILITASGAKLLDFGLAKMKDPTNPGDSTISIALTQPGSILGTVSYMSPEQAQGHDVDERSDVFAFGAVLYEALSGRRAFKRETQFATITAVVAEEPEPLDAPPALERIVRRCLAKRLSDRFQSMAEVTAALERVVVKPTGQQPSIAVLPFANMSADKENEYFSDGLAEEIINALTQIPGLRVIARTSAFRFRGEHDLRKVAEALGVETVLEGSVRKAGNRLRITAQLIHADDDSHIWSERYDREMADVFAIQDEIAQAIAGKLKLRLEGCGADARPRHQPNIDAYHAFLKGRYWGAKLSPEAVVRSFESYGTAIALDPAYAMPHVGIAFNHFTLAATGAASAPEHVPQARAKLLQALEMNPDLADARLMLGIMRGAFDYDWKTAEEETRRALACGPVGSEALASYARMFLWPTGRFREAWNAVEKAHELDPLSALVMYLFGEIRAVEGRFEEALAFFRQSLELDPEYWVSHVLIASCELHLGRIERMAEPVQALERLQPGHVITQRLRAVFAALTGHPEEARRLRDDLAEHRATRYCSWYYIGEIDRCLGDLDGTFRYWNMAIDERDPLALWIPTAIYAMLKADPRHPALLARMNLSATISSS